jgi:signal transduction histidine kinase
MPEGYALLYRAALNSTNIFFGTVVLTTFWVHRRNMGQGTFVLFFFCFCVPLAAGMFEIVLTLSPTALTPLSLFHLAPVFLASVAIYLFISQLITAMKTSKARAGELERLAEEIQAELALSYETLAREREKSAIDKERSRILLDLHDGVGGILANTIAYIDNHGRGDDVIRASLSEALRDLGLMLDGLENSHSLATLLGMMRERLEPLMNDHNLSFDWQVEEEPQIPHQGPSHNLAVARIVQEAITNTIKHANASSIRIYTQQDLVRVSDNGRGFDVTAEPRQGYGLMGMRRRAADLGIGLEIKSGQSGTQISLFLNPQTV